MGSKVTVADACAIVTYRNITLSGFLLDVIIVQADYRDNIEIPVYRATLHLSRQHILKYNIPTAL